MQRNLYKGNMRWILFGSIWVQILCVCLLIYAHTRISRVAQNNIRQYADRYVERVEADLNRNNTYMSQNTVLVKDYRTMFEQSSLELVNRIEELQKMYKLLSALSESEYNFFIFDRNDEKFVELTAVHLSFSSYRQIRPCIIDWLWEEPRNGSLHLLDTPEQRILATAWIYGDFVVGSWIGEESFLSGMSMLDCGPGGGISLVRREAVDRDAGAGFGTSVLWYRLENIEADFEIRVAVSGQGEIYQIMLLQIAQFLLTSQLMVMMLLLIRQVRRRLIVPVKNLSRVLDRYRGSLAEEEEEHAGSRIPAAVEDAYEILDRLGKKAEKLSVELYETELAKKQLEINFRQFQIRPHFFVNCLAMIFGMAQVQDTGKIQEVTVCLSEYYRYLLHDCMDMMPLWREIHHMETIIRVNFEWNSQGLSFDYDMEDEVREWEIPVLMVSTFLENSLKHAVGPGGTLAIRLTARRETQAGKEALYLKITDNGEGFPGEMLRRLNSGTWDMEQEGRHIGISNVLQRLKLIYNEEARVLFSTPEEGGACVEIYIPREVK